MKKKFNPSVPRRMYWSDEIEDGRQCPRCRSQLENESHAYILVVRDKGEYSPFIIGHDFGYFCPECPVVVLDREEAHTIIGVINIESASCEYVVLGIVDMDAIPPYKTAVSLGDDDNPVPLVEFINPEEEKRSRKRRQAFVRVQTEEREREILQICNRNDWQVIVSVEPGKPEDITDIERLLNPPRPEKKSASEPGRNDPCPCGSGKKYKKCCLRKQ